MVPHKSLEVLAVATAFGLLLGAHPAAALVCQDPESGTTRESGTDSCELGERQILPEVPAPAPARAAPAMRDEASRCLEGASVAEIEERIRSNFGPVIFGSGQVIINAADGPSDSTTYIAKLGHLDAHPVVEGQMGPARLTMHCLSGNCWMARSPHGSTAARSASFLVGDRGRAQRSAEALGQLIQLCGAGAVKASQ